METWPIGCPMRIRRMRLKVCDNYDTHERMKLLLNIKFVLRFIFIILNHCPIRSLSQHRKLLIPPNPSFQPPRQRNNKPFPYRKIKPNNPKLIVMTETKLSWFTLLVSWYSGSWVFCLKIIFFYLFSQVPAMLKERGGGRRLGGGDVQGWLGFPIWKV